MAKISKKVAPLVMLPLSALFFFSGVVMAQATTYYVATTGNDSNNGTAVGTPFLTIQKCISVVAAGDTCTVADGTYSSPTGTPRMIGLIYTSAGGTAGSPITLKSTNLLGAHVIVPGNIDGSYGFYVSRNYWIIEGFDISGGGVPGSAAITGIGVYANGIIVRKNTIHEIGAGICSSHTAGYQGIYVENGVQNTIIEDNLIHTIGRLRTGESGCAAGQSTNDHGIYAASAPGGLKIRRNVFYDDYRGWPIHIYLPGASTTANLEIYHNTFARKNPFAATPFGHILLQTRTLTNISIKNNISYDAHLGMVLCNSPYILIATNVTISNNLSNTGINTLPCKAGITFSNNMTFTDPGFVNGPSNNFKLDAGSAARNAGTNVGLQFNGTAPDIGAYEFGVGGDILAPRAPIGLFIH